MKQQLMLTLVVSALLGYPNEVHAQTKHDQKLRMPDTAYKYARMVEAELGVLIKAGGFSRFALYDVSADPGQTKDISKQHPEVTARLKQKLLAIYKSIMSDAPDWHVAKNEK